MAGNYLRCDLPNCQQSAYMFAFSPANAKTKVCRAHLYSLTDQQISVYAISAFQFMEMPGDSTAYEANLEMYRKGLKNIELLERKCDEDLEVAQNTLQAAKASVLQVVESGFQELQLRLVQRYSDVHRELEHLRSNVERLPLDKYFQLFPEDAALCEVAPSGRLFEVKETCAREVELVVRGMCALLPEDSSVRQLVCACCRHPSNPFNWSVCQKCMSWRCRQCSTLNMRVQTTCAVCCPKKAFPFSFF